MSHALNKIYIHAIFGTKKRRQFISQEIESELYDFLKKELIRLNCYCEIINGTEDHIHLLFVLNRNHSIASVVKQLKGASSHWLNSEKSLKQKFEWQTGYSAYSVSEFHLKTIYNYIKNQKEHHNPKTKFSDEDILYLNSKLTPRLKSLN